MSVNVVGERGQITIPKEIRERLGIKPRSAVILEVRPEGLLIRPTATVPIRIFSDEFVHELDSENSLRKGEREKILKKWKR